VKQRALATELKKQYDARQNNTVCCKQSHLSIYLSLHLHLLQGPNPSACRNKEPLLFIQYFVLSSPYLLSPNQTIIPLPCLSIPYPPSLLFPSLRISSFTCLLQTSRKPSLPYRVVQPHGNSCSWKLPLMLQDMSETLINTRFRPCMRRPFTLLPSHHPLLSTFAYLTVPQDS